MDNAPVKRYLLYLRYWALAVIGLLIAVSVLDDGYVLPAVFVALVSIIWFGISFLSTRR